MFKTRLNLWAFRKYLSRADWQVFAVLQEHRRAAGKPPCKIEIHNKIRSEGDFAKYLKQQNTSKATFLAEALAANLSIPEDFHCLDTAAGQFMPAKPLLDPSQLDPFQVPTDLSASTAEQMPVRQHSAREPGADHFQSSGGSSYAPHQFISNDDGRQDPQPDDASFICPHEISSGGLLSPVWQPEASMAIAMAHQDNPTLCSTIAHAYKSAASVRLVDSDGFELIAGVGVDGTTASASCNGDIDRSASVMPNFMDNMASIPTEYHGPSTKQNKAAGSIPPRGMGDVDNVAREQQEDRGAFEAACQAACMWEASGNSDFFAVCLEQSKSLFRKMCISENPMILIAASTMLTWLTVHVERPLAGSVMRASYRVASNVLGDNNPVCVLLEWMTLVAATKLKDSQIDSKSLHEIWKIDSRNLHRIWTDFLDAYGEDDPRTIVALYCLSFHLLKVDKAFLQAENYLSDLQTICIRSLGFRDLQTINAIATLSRAQSRQEKYDLAYETIDISLAVSPLGLYHPHRLELLVRKAVICRKLKRMDEAEVYYWLVFRARVATLGKRHASTRQARKSLKFMLELNGTWETREAEVEAFAINPQIDVSEEESWWRRESGRNSFEGTRASSEEEML
jgi:hypothetical protein